MAKNGARAPRAVNASGKQDADGNEIRNLILRGLPRNESDQILPSLEFVRLNLHQVLHEVGETIRSGYFLNNGLGSVLTVQPDGKSVEVGLIGKEGFIGIPIIFGFKTSGLRVVTQAPGTGFPWAQERPKTSATKSHGHRPGLCLGPVEDAGSVSGRRPGGDRQ